jgi:hypothetical protein
MKKRYHIECRTCGVSLSLRLHFEQSVYSFPITKPAGHCTTGPRSFSSGREASDNTAQTVLIGGRPRSGSPLRVARVPTM